ncbi:MAG: hypothetical protein L0H79_17885 [Intrasporangium sp.]|uniref:hypothetical protein n=1 Tax=Intrasporangium sp. TaxID=1925024 RepID=UPI00264A06CD|nr:hypothetical protein [Intrasporangium sp.]MDN5797601.1 hypothetical protein [Intrasporangium sp.]
MRRFEASSLCLCVELADTLGLIALKLQVDRLLRHERPGSVPGLLGVLRRTFFLVAIRNQPCRADAHRLSEQPIIVLSLNAER